MVSAEVQDIPLHWWTERSPRDDSIRLATTLIVVLLNQSVRTVTYNWAESRQPEVVQR